MLLHIYAGFLYIYAEGENERLFSPAPREDLSERVAFVIIFHFVALSRFLLFYGMIHHYGRGLVGFCGLCVVFGGMFPPFSCSLYLYHTPQGEGVLLAPLKPLVTTLSNHAAPY
jgi:hypothetical protein